MPTGSPVVLPPVPMPEDAFSDVTKTFDLLPIASQQWWKDFADDQFFFLPDEDPIIELWDFPDEVNVPAPDLPNPALDNTNPIHFADQPVSALDGVCIGDIIALRPRGATHDTFWIAEVVDKNDDDNRFLLQYYWQNETNPRRYDKDETCVGWCNPVDVIHHGFHFTQHGQMLRAVDLNTIQRILDQDMDI